MLRPAYAQDKIVRLRLLFHVNRRCPDAVVYAGRGIPCSGVGQGEALGKTMEEERALMKMKKKGRYAKERRGQGKSCRTSTTVAVDVLKELADANP